MAAIEQGNLELMRAAVEAAGILMTEVAEQCQLPLTDGKLEDEQVRRFIWMHVTVVQEYYDAFCRSTGVWKVEQVHIGQALATPPAPVPGPAGPLPPLPSQVLGNVVGAIAGAIPKL